MTIVSTPSEPQTSPWPGRLLIAGAALTYLVITLGGLICVTTPGKGCPDWPGCFGGIIPPAQVGAIIEMTHRFIAALTLPVLIGAAVASRRNKGWLGATHRLPIAALVLLLCVAGFGALAVLRGLSPALAAIDVGSALLVVAFMFTAAVIARARQTPPTPPDQLVYRGPLAWMALAAMIAVYFVIVSGMFTAGPGSRTQCLGGPLFGASLALAQGAEALQGVRRVVAGLAALLVVGSAVQAWRTLPRNSPVVIAATVAGVLFAVEIVIAWLMVTAGFVIWLLVPTVVVAAALWAALVVLVILVGLPTPSYAQLR
jgi:heme a synthase